MRFAHDFHAYDIWPVSYSLINANSASRAKAKKELKARFLRADQKNKNALPPPKTSPGKQRKAESEHLPVKSTIDATRDSLPGARGLPPAGLRCKPKVADALDCTRCLGLPMSSTGGCKSWSLELTMVPWDGDHDAVSDKDIEVPRVLRMTCRLYPTRT